MPAYPRACLPLLLAPLAAALTACDVGDTVASSLDGAVVPTGCSAEGGAPPQAAPGGYYVNGNTLCTAAGKPHLLHGVDRPSLEWDASGEDLSAADFAL